MTKMYIQKYDTTNNVLFWSKCRLFMSEWKNCKEYEYPSSSKDSRSRYPKQYPIMWDQTKTQMCIRDRYYRRHSGSSCPVLWSLNHFSYVHILCKEINHQSKRKLYIHFAINLCQLHVPAVSWRPKLSTKQQSSLLENSYILTIVQMDLSNRKKSSSSKIIYLAIA